MTKAQYRKAREEPHQGAAVVPGLRQGNASLVHFFSSLMRFPRPQSAASGFRSADVRAVNAARRFATSSTSAETRPSYIA